MTGKTYAAASGSSRAAFKLFYPLLASTIGATAFWGFFYTYFGPIFGGVYQPVSVAVHVHGWSFLLWYLVFPLQTLLIASGHAGWHMALGKISLALAFAMLFTGLLVLSVRLKGAFAGASDGFSISLLSNGPLILASLVLFVVFYAVAIIAAVKGQFAEHKRLMVLASSAGLGAAVFRIFGVLIGFGPWTIATAVLATNIFVVVGMVYDKFRRGAVHRVYWLGLGIALGVELLVTPFPGNPVIVPINSAVAALAELLAVFY